MWLTLIMFVQTNFLQVVAQTGIAVYKCVRVCRLLSHGYMKKSIEDGRTFTQTQTQARAPRLHPLLYPIDCSSTIRLFGSKNVTCIRSSSHHGSHTRRGPRDDGFRQGCCEKCALDQTSKISSGSIGFVAE
ncbi:hypothetical protein ACQKWADRAFT_284146 [Trichoderma austrokoningii]